MISYALITKDKLSHSIQPICSVLALPDHDFELIIHAPLDAIQDNSDTLIVENKKVRYIPDTAKKGSPHAFNNIISLANGKYISYLLNNIAYPPNFLDVLEYIENGEGSKKEIKLVNIMWQGGPGIYNNYHADARVNGVFWPNTASTPVREELTPYPVIPLPFVAVETVDKYLNGHIFNPTFKNHYPDHWLGFFISRHEQYKPYEWNCPTIQYHQSSYARVSSTTTDREDAENLQRLTDQFITQPNNYIA